MRTRTSKVDARSASAARVQLDLHPELGGRVLTFPANREPVELVDTMEGRPTIAFFHSIR